jgi:hypothetical protein
MLQLSAQQSLHMQVDRKPVPLRHYLKQPRRLVQALMNPAQVKELGQGRFRFYLKGIQFFMLSIRPVVDLHIDVSQGHLLRVKSPGCKIEGSDFVNQRFRLSLSGTLRLDEQATVTHVQGMADLAIAVEMPPVLAMTPKSLLETTGNQILKGVLLTMKQRLMRQLIADYERWSYQQASATTPQLSLMQRPSQAS